MTSEIAQHQRTGFMCWAEQVLTADCLLCSPFERTRSEQFQPDPCRRKKGGSTMKPLKKIPRFDYEDQERKFWSSKDSSAYIDYRKSVRASFSNLKPSSRTISIRLPESLLERIRVIANRADVPYQSMMKVLLDEKVSEVLRTRKQKRSAA